MTTTLSNTFWALKDPENADVRAIMEHYTIGQSRVDPHQLYEDLWELARLIIDARGASAPPQPSAPVQANSPAN